MGSVAPRSLRAILTLVVVVSLVVFAGQLSASPANALSTLTATPTPTITGTAQVGAELTVVPGTWAPSPVALSYQWFADGVPVPAATRSTFIATATQLTDTMTVRVTGSRAGYAAVSRTSSPTAAVAPQATFTKVGKPSAGGTGRAGTPYVALPGTWSPTPATFTYQWYLADVAVRGATGVTYSPPASAVGEWVTVAVTGSTPGYVSATRMSHTSRRILPVLRFSKTPIPTIAGSVRVGYPLRAVPGNWTPDPITFTYQWYTDNVAIAGATSDVFVPPPTDLGQSLSVQVTGSQSGFTSVTESSGATDRVAAGSDIPATTVESVSSEGLGVDVAWTPSPSDVGVTDYLVSVTPLPGAVAATCAVPAVESDTVPASDTSDVVSGLCPGIAYTAEVTPYINDDAGPASLDSQPVAPLTVQSPQPPLLVSTTPRDGSLIETWSASPYDGGSAITGYRLTATANGSTTTLNAAADSNSATFAGLTDGQAYAISLVAVNAAGVSTPSTATGTPSATYAPSAPTNFTLQPDGNGGILATWGAPDDTGGAPITEYAVNYEQVSEANDGSWSPVADATPQSVTTDGTTTQTLIDTFDPVDGYYEFSITAANEAGTGSEAEAQNPATPSFGADGDTVVLSSQTVDALASVTPTTLVWALPAPSQASGLSDGDEIVSGAGGLLPDGTLRRVTGISTSGSNLVVTTVAGNLSDEFTSASVATSVDPAAGFGTTSGPHSRTFNSLSQPFEGTDTFHPATAGVQLVTTDIGGSVSLSKSMTFALSFHGSSGSGCDSDVGSCKKFDVTGSVNVTPSVSLGLDISQDFIGIPDGLSMNATAKVTATANVTATVSASQTWEIGEIDGAPYDIQAGPVPIVIVPKVPVYLTVSGDAAVGVTASITVGASVDWSSASPNKLTTTNLSTPLTVSGGTIPGLSATGDASLSVQAQPQLDIYDVAGPNVEADVNFDAAFNFNPGPGDAFLTLSSELVLKGGLDLDLFGIHLSLDAEIAKKSFPDFVIGPVPSPSYSITTISPTVAVGQPATLAAVRNDGANVPLRWGLSGGVSGDQVSPSGVFTPAAPAGRQVTIIVSDSSGAVGQTTLTVGTPFDPPLGLAASTPFGTQNSVYVAWSPPANTGGSAIASYQVTTQPSTGTHSVTGTSVTLTGLSPASYAVSVRAINKNGLLSSPASALVQVGPDAPAGGTVGAASGQTLALPSGASAIEAFVISCPEDGLCFGLGEDTQNKPIFYTMNNGSGGPTSLPLPSDAMPLVPQIDNVACDGGGTCLAVGYYTSLSGVAKPLIEMRSKAGTWTPATLPSADPSDPTFSGGVVNVGCDGIDSCYASGSSGSVQAMFHWNGIRWTVAPIALPSGAISGQSVLALACAVGVCATYGFYSIDSNTTFNSVGHESGGVWSFVRAPVPAGADGAIPGLDSISCAPGGTCVIGGGYSFPGGQNSALLETMTGGNWIATNAAPPEGLTGTITSSYIFATGCAAANSCVAVGEWFRSIGQGYGVNEVLDNGQWTPSESPPPQTAGVQNFTVVSCSTSQICAAIGPVAGGSGVRSSAVELLKADSWSALGSVDMPVPAQGASSSSFFSSVSCTTEPVCYIGGISEGVPAIVAIPVG